MEKLNVFKCAKCGNIVEVMHVGGGELTCCGEAMKQLRENTTEGKSKSAASLTQCRTIISSSGSRSSTATKFAENS